MRTRTAEMGPVRRMVRRMPLTVVLAGLLAASMMVPAVHASVAGADREAQAFFYSGILLLAACAAIGLASARPRSADVTRSHLIALLAAFTLLPAMAAVPLTQIVPDATLLDLYVEMVAAMTTTGGSLFAPEALSDSVHLWRATVAWEGGLTIWVAAVAILAPLNLGGFEVAEGNTARRGDRARWADAAGPDARLLRASASLVPIYAGLTGGLWGLLTAAGEDAVTALIHAMSTLSTSGIVNDTDVPGNAAGLAGEALVAAFLVFALSRGLFATDMNRDHVRHLTDDRELRVAGLIVGGLTIVLFARHWIGAYEVGSLHDLRAAAGAAWGSAFTVLSFLTTTGFESAEWQAAREWSGLGAPSALLLGLAMFGGGVATTAGGVKLLRIYALYDHGRHEMARLVHPHAVTGIRAGRRRVPKGGTEAAWVFFMLFATSLAAATLAFTATGIEFEAGMVLAIACLTTTGPLGELVLGSQGAVDALPDLSKGVAAAVMVVGRLESLALIALLNPDFWRD